MSPHKDGFKPELSIIIPVYNLADYTVKCLASVRANTRIPHEIIWIDNGSSPTEFNKVKYQATRPRVRTKLVKFNKNIGFIKATNAGIREAEGNYVILLNNDTQVTEGWEKELLRPLKQDKKIGAVGPITQSRIAWQEATHLNRRWDLGLPIFEHGCDIDDHAKLLLQGFAGKYIDIGKLPLSFFCVAMRKETLDEIGFLEEELNIGLADDDLYCHKLRSKGYKLMLSLGSFIYHKHRATFGLLKLDVDSIRRYNVKVMKRKIKEYEKTCRS